MSDFETVPRGTLEELEAVKAERDAMAAHVERLRDAFQSAVESDWLEPIDQALNQTPTTSLTRLKSQWQAEALEEFANVFGPNNEAQDAVIRDCLDCAAKLRHQAEADQ